MLQDNTPKEALLLYFHREKEGSKMDSAEPLSVRDFLIPSLALCFHEKEFLETGEKCYYPTEGAPQMHSAPLPRFCGFPTFWTGRIKQGKTLRIFLGDLCELSTSHTLDIDLGSFKTPCQQQSCRKQSETLDCTQPGALGCKRLTNGVHSQRSSGISNVIL